MPASNKLEVPLILPVYLEGSAAAIGIANGVEIRSALDGRVIATIADPSLNPFPRVSGGWWSLARGGTYICSGSSSGLRIWDIDGNLIGSKMGDYSTASVFADSGEVRIANGPTGTSKIETFHVRSVDDWTDLFGNI